ncbi:MAG: hypothetical protein OXG84_03035 [Chloroflexi bacterium]|nr:hypothetical protein [Chloroflexota bacterium]
MKASFVVLLFILGITIAQGQMARAPDSDGEEPCYDHAAVRLAGAMNIREQPTVDSNKVGLANRGDLFTQSATHEGRDYCWIQVEPGWMAVTGNVVGLEKTKVVGPPEYRDYMNRVLKWLERKNLDAYRDVMLYTRVIADKAPPGERKNWKSAPQAFLKHDWIYMPLSETLEREMWSLVTPGERYLFVAGVVFHETCHLKQHHEERICRRPISEIETECFAASVKMMAEIDRWSTATKMMRHGLSNVDSVYSSNPYPC